MQPTRKHLLRWCIWFFVGNIPLFWIIGCNFLFNIPWIHTPYLNSYGKFVLTSFAIVTFIGHLGLLAILPGIIPIFLTFIFPRRNFIFAVSMLIATAAATFLIIDTETYKLFHFHINGLIIDLISHGLSEEVFGLSWTEYFAAAGICAAILTTEIIFGIWLWRFFAKRPNLRRRGLLGCVAALLGVSLYVSYSLIIYSGGSLLVRAFIDVGHFLPLYTEVFGAVLPMKDGRFWVESLGQTCLVQPEKIKSPLNYPLHPLTVAPTKPPKNILFIVVDTWRFDMLNPQVMPVLTDFSKTSWVFSNHFSGGNATGPGIFSLFYGMPVSYWTAMEEQHRGPIFIDELLKQHYQTGIFGSASLRLPAFNQTVFSAIKNLQIKTQGKTTYDRDRKITQEFKDFIAKVAKQKQPFFSFLFYDAAHSYCSFDEDLQPFEPAIKKCNRLELTNESDPIPYLNRYKNALLLVDQQIKQVVDTLKANHLFDNTIIVITGDHGEEFNDNHQGYWGHASNFTHYQVQTPLIIHWPGKAPEVFTHQTTHFDIVPTLMKLALGCAASSSDYSLGKSLFDPRSRNYLIIGSYIGLGVVEHDRITNISQTGNFRMERPNGQSAPDVKVDLPVIRLVFQDMRRFYK